MKKFKYYFLLLAMMIGGMSSCTHDFEPMSQAEIDKAKYDHAFLTYVGGTIAPTQDWGFGNSMTKGLTRATFTDKWTNDHSCNWGNKLTFTLPAGAVDVTQPNFDKSGSVYYIPEGTTGEVSLGWLGLNAGAELYNYGNITAINDVNYNGVITFYNAGTITNFGPSSGGRHTVVNIGSMTVCGYANIGDLYNGGALVLEREHNPYWPNEGGKADIPDAMKIYSNGTATIEMPDGGDLKAVCDIHGTLKVGDGKNLKIQNSTTKYVCGIESTANVENVDGPLQTSYVKANLFTFDGNPIYLLPGGHVDVTTLQVPNSNCHVYGHTGSVALIEATNVEFGNKNDFTHTFSDNIYFKVSGSVKVDNCYAMGQSHNFNNVSDYLADTTHADEFALAANRVNAGNASGSPACGQPWTVGTTATYDLRIIAEDLSADAADDFDFNDVVIDVKYGNPAVIEVKAAGGTLPLRICGNDAWEVHDLFGVDTDCMVNTGASAKGLKGQDNLTTAPLQLDFEVNSPEDAKAIKIEVKKNGEWQELTAETGKSTAKIAVDTSFDWLDERVSIKEKYPNFTEWVKGMLESAKWWK